MYPFRYEISLRFRHPSIDPAIISKQLRIKPRWSWKAGEPRKTPKGTALSGNRSESYWTAPLQSKKTLYSRTTDFEEYLISIAHKLKPHASFIKKIIKGGGGAELFVGLYGSKNFGMDLRPKLLHDLGKLGLRLSLDIYP
jgi:Domain of unknown function (DUF4279)